MLEGESNEKVNFKNLPPHVLISILIMENNFNVEIFVTENHYVLIKKY